MVIDMKTAIKLKTVTLNIITVLLLTLSFSKALYADQLEYALVNGGELSIDVGAVSVEVNGQKGKADAASAITIDGAPELVKTLNVSENENGIQVTIGNDGKTLESHNLIIRLSEGVNVSVKTKTGNVSINNMAAHSVAHSVDGTVVASNMSGGQQLSSVNGDVVLNDASGVHEIDSINGKITLKKVLGALSVKNVSGEIEVQSSLTTLNASSMKGGIQGRLDGVEKVQLETVNGDVNLELHPQDASSILIETVSGNVRLGVDESLSASFNLAVHQSGTIENDFASDGAKEDGDSKKAVFKLGDGSSSIDVSTLNGNIAIKKLEKAIASEDKAEAGAQFDWSSVDQSKLQFAFVKPDVNFSSYKTVYISKVKIVFDEQWVRQFGSSGYKKYIERVEERYAERFKQALVKEIKEKTSWKIVKSREPDALIIMPKVTDLYINTPEEIGMRDTVITMGGRAALDLTIYSPVDKSVWGMFVDKRNSARLSSAESTMRTRVANEKSFAKLFSYWGETVMDYVKH